jgi:glycogen debranching enzyme
MQIVHRFGKKEINGEGSSNFLLMGKSGCYFSLNADAEHQNMSVYQGLFHPVATADNDWTMFKSLENIHPDRICDTIINDFQSVTRKYGTSEETFNLINNMLCYSMKSYEGYINIDLDMRPVHNFEGFGRIYKIYSEDDCIIIEYAKYEDENLTQLLYTKYLVIRGAKEYEIVNTWEKKEYWYDKNRNARSEFYIYKALRVKCDSLLRLFISFSDTKKKGMNKANYAHEYHEMLQHEKEQQAHALFNKTSIEHAHHFALNLAIKSLSELSVDLLLRYKKVQGIYAGLPWFYQFWSRDELITTIGLIKTERLEEAKAIFFKYLEAINEYGRIPNRLPGANLGSADAIGWLFKRLGDFINLLEKTKQTDELLTREELRYIHGKLRSTIDSIKKHYVGEGLIYNDPKETWMDTEWNNDNRSGFRIEIQALYLYMLRLRNQLNKKMGMRKKDEELEEEVFCASVKKKFFNGQKLYDGSDDPTIRPNVFLAYYVYPDLLKNKEWELVFNTTLHGLWLDWGGLASIDKTSALFCNYYTGLNNQSYHRGDSWYFMNHIAAVCMLRLDKKQYMGYIQKIIAASTTETLWMGFIGHNAEVSSAAEIRSEGCLAQAWSTATFIELIKEFED